MAWLVPAIPMLRHGRARSGHPDVECHDIACAIGMCGSSPRMTADVGCCGMIFPKTGDHPGSRPGQAFSGLSAGDEIRCQPVPDRLGDDLDCMVFGIALRALPGEPLLRTRNVGVDVRKRAVADGNLAGR